MSGYLAVKTVGNSVAISICGRCQKKMYYGDLQMDPNTKNYFCKDCVDKYDPWRLPARKAEDVGLQHPRPDTKIDPGAW